MASDTDNVQSATWLCQKRKYLLLSLLIQGPKHPGIDIDIFLEPLMQEMETLWKEGIDIYDGFARQPFNLRAIIFVTIHDYQALFVLSGQIKGRTGCTVCVDDTVSSFLEGSRKVVYLGYRRFLVEGHRYRSKFYNHFDGNPEFRSTPDGPMPSGYPVLYRPHLVDLYQDQTPPLPEANHSVALAPILPPPACDLGTGSSHVTWR